MITNRSGRGMRPLFRAVWTDAAAGQTDGQLLARFVAHRDEAAFAALVYRHGPMVLGVCRRVLGNAADAEDAFQATFIVLLRKAAALGGRAVLGDYLHGIARRTALKARTNAARRRAKERRLARPALSVEGRNDWLPRLDEELSHLPEKYRLPVVLCNLEGKTRREAANQLGWPEGTVAGRLARGRALLAKRLLRAAAAGELPETLGRSLAPAALPAALVGSTVQAAASAVAGDMTVGIGAVTLAQGVLQNMFWNKLKIAAAVLLACVVAAGVGGGTYRVAAGDGPVAAIGAADETTTAKPPPAAAAAQTKKRPPIICEIELQGFRVVLPPDGATAQFIIPDVEQLAKVTRDKEGQSKINGQVDFNTQRLLYFTGLEPEVKLSYRVDEGETGPVVVFRYVPEAVATYTKRHAHLFALAKNVGFKTEEDKAPPPAALAVRELDLKGFKGEARKGLVPKPTTITDRDELANALRNEECQLRIAKQVDFTTERLLFFAWSGSGGDKLWFVDGKDGLGPMVVFRYSYGEDPSFVSHFRLFALGKGVRSKVEESKSIPPAPAPHKDDSTAKLLKDLDSDNVFARAAAIDLLGERKAIEAVPRLIEMVADGAALVGSDNYVGLHAMNALVKITGQAFGSDQKHWQAWWKEQRQEAGGPGVAGDGAVKVLNAEATVELRGLLVHTPKGTFVMVRDQRPGGAKEGEVVTWELDFGKTAADLEQQAKDLSGKSVVVSGTCKMAPAPTYGANPMNPSLPSGSEWRLEKTVVVARLIADGKK